MPLQYIRSKQLQKLRLRRRRISFAANFGHVRMQPVSFRHSPADFWTVWKENQKISNYWSAHHAGCPSSLRTAELSCDAEAWGWTAISEFEADASCDSKNFHISLSFHAARCITAVGGLEVGNLPEKCMLRRALHKRQFSKNATDSPRVSYTNFSTTEWNNKNSRKQRVS